jgi:hypothetical protein
VFLRPFGVTHCVKSTTAFPISGYYRVSDNEPGHRISDPMPCRGIAYQPRVPTLGIHPDKQPRVLKERRIGCVPRTSAPLCLQVQWNYGVPDIGIDDDERAVWD